MAKGKLAFRAKRKHHGSVSVSLLDEPHMRNSLLISVLTLTVLGARGTAADAPAKPSAWLTDYAAAKQLARQTGKPIFAVFR